MAKLGINTGSAANDGTGDGLRLGGGKVNDNFDEIYSAIGDGTTLRIGTGSTCAITVGESQVGIGSQIPAYMLDVRGGIGATNISISGIATVVDLRGVTAIDATTTATIEAATAGMPNEFEYINVTGMGTIANFRSGISTITTSVEVGTAVTLAASGINVAGVSTLAGSVTMDSAVVGSAVTIAPTGINVAGVSTLAGSVTMDSAVVGSAVTISASGISISGIATVVGLTSPTITATTSTFVGSAVTTDSGGIRVAGVVTATSFIGKYFDGTVIGDVQVGTSLTAYSHGVVTSGIVTAQGGFITGSGTTAVQMSISGNNLLFTVVGIGTTHLVLVP